MLTNTESKIQIDEFQELMGEQSLSAVEYVNKAAANAPQFDDVKGAERSSRRERRNHRSTVFTPRGWRVTTW